MNHLKNGIKVESMQKLTDSFVVIISITEDHWLWWVTKNKTYTLHNQTPCLELKAL